MHIVAILIKYYKRNVKLHFKLQMTVKSVCWIVHKVILQYASFLDHGNTYEVSVFGCGDLQTSLRCLVWEMPPLAAPRSGLRWVGGSAEQSRASASCIHPLFSSGDWVIRKCLAVSVSCVLAGVWLVADEKNRSRDNPVRQSAILRTVGEVVSRASFIHADNAHTHSSNLWFIERITHLKMIYWKYTFKVKTLACIFSPSHINLCNKKNKNPQHLVQLECSNYSCLTLVIVYQMLWKKQSERGLRAAVSLSAAIYLCRSVRH